MSTRWEVDYEPRVYKDMVEVVRCKDCVNLYKGEFQSTCRYATYIYSMDDYCSHGERKDDETDRR